MRVWTPLRIIIVFFLCLYRSTAFRPVADAIDLEPSEPNASHVAEPNVTAQDDEEDCDRTWGDIFEGTKDILLSLDFLWLGLSALLAVGILLWMPEALRIDGVGTGFADGDLEPIAWYKVAFNSLGSHAAGLVGFAGFQKILVARILMTGDPCDFFSISDALLFVTLALSAFAMISSFVFLYVDYMRRLAIETALQKEIQLILTPGVLHSTGLGIAILLFGGLTLFLYGLQIIKEVVWSTAKQDDEETSHWYLQVLPRTAGACLSVALFYANLHGLHRSPKVQFDSTCPAAEDKTFKTLKKVKLEEFLRDLSDGPPSLPDWATNGLKKVGGEDLASIATHGSRQAFFPNRRRSPLVHAVLGILFVGVCPLAIQIGSQKLFFVSPRLDDLKEVTGTTAEVSEKHKTSIWQTLGMFTEESGRPIREFLLLPKSSKVGHLQVAFENGQTSRVQLCCGRCETKIFKHSLTELPGKPKTFEFPTNVTNCSLKLFGLSNGFVTKVSLIVVPKDKHNFCDCSGQRCDCCENFQGHWDFKEWNNNTFAKLHSRRPPCTPINSCPDHENITEQGACVEAICDVVDSNLKPGRNCSCKDGFSGNITWKRAIPRGSCVPAECKVNHSNQLPGKKCECLHGYTGSIQWDGSMVLGTCEPVSCVEDKLNGKSGPGCRCKDGYKGQPHLHGDIFTNGNCSLAECGIPNSRGSGPDCKCAEHHTGTIRWKGPTATGMCQKMRCVGQHSNGRSGAGCDCEVGFAGNVTKISEDGEELLWAACEPAPCHMLRGSNRKAGPNCGCLPGHMGSRMWNAVHKFYEGDCAPLPCEGNTTNGVEGFGCRCKDGFIGSVHVGLQAMVDHCKPAPCSIGPGSNGIHGPGCGCKDGYIGSAQWNYQFEQYMGACVEATCNIPYSNNRPGTHCACRSGYTGQISWFGPRAFGKCEPMPCVGNHTNGVRGPGCRCMDGFTGSVVEANHTERIEDEWEDEGWTEKTYEAMVGDCEPAPCNVENSNREGGLDCKCQIGYTGKLAWVGAKVFGECKLLPCAGRNMNGVAGPDCRCLDGFRGSLRVANVSFSAWNEFYEWEVKYKEALTADCEPAPCHVSNSNQVPGPGCRCLDGYTGSIEWHQDHAFKTNPCKPAPCLIQNSNQQDGLECRCLDGYNGSITWEGPVPSGTCTALPCRVLHSDFAAGPDCQCLPGFYGQIAWTGTQTHGNCLPLPVCSEHVVLTTWLKTDVKDFEDQECAAGQQLVFHGHLCEEMEGTIVWTSARAQPPGRCTWHWPVEEKCGQDLNQITALIAQVSPQVPMQCSTQAARPRCGAEMNYITTSLVSSHYTCDGEADERVDSLQLPQLVQFHGRPCGYDLIRWEAATVFHHPEHSTSHTLPCKIRNQHNQSLECGEIPLAEQLPHGCLRAREPAVFAIEHRSDKQSNNSAKLWSAVHFVKLLDSGMILATGSLSPSGVAASSHLFTDTSWQTDGKYISFEVTEEFHDAFNLYTFLGMRAADDKVGSKFTDPSGKLRLVARNSLPSWWASKFADAAEPRDFNIDAMMGCQLSAFQNGTCYRTYMGYTVMIFKAEKETCLAGGHDVPEAGKWYKYMFSESGTQSYSSSTSCLPRANHHELQLEIANLRLEAGSEPTVVAMKTPCRTNLRFVVNVDKLKCKENMKTAFNVMKVYGQ